MLLLHTGWGLPVRAGAPMAIVAHRGDLDLYPEDTLEAIIAVAATQADGVEFDVHQSASGEWWVIHDPTLDRTTDATGSIYAMSDADIERATIDGGLGFEPDRHHGLKVPRLREVLDQLAGFDGTLYVDLQHAVDADPANLAIALEGHDAVVLCRNKDDILAIRAAAPDLGVLIRPYHDEVAHLTDGWIADAWSEATPDSVRTSAMPFITYVDDAQAASEMPLLRRAWASGVHAFLTKQLEAALTERDRLAGH